MEEAEVLELPPPAAAVAAVSSTSRRAPATSTAEGLALAFRDISYTVKLKRKNREGKSTKCVLSGLTGVCQPGRVMVIMGPSCAGKTSLLDVLAGRANASTGQMSLGSKVPCDPSDVQRRAAYVQQDDILF